MIRTLGVYALAALAAAGGLWLLDVFTLQGLTAAVWPWADTTGLRWPLGTRLVYWTALFEACVGVVAALIWREARLECPTRRDLWLAAHISLAQRAARRARWAWGGVLAGVAQHRAHRPVPIPAATTPHTSAPRATSSNEATAA